MRKRLSFLALLTADCRYKKIASSLSIISIAFSMCFVNTGCTAGRQEVLKGIWVDGQVLHQGHFTPVKDDAYNLGSATREWKDIYCAGTLTVDSNIVNLSDVTDEYVLAFDTATDTWRGVVMTGGGDSGWEVDANDDLMPVAGAFTAVFWELDGNDDLMPRS